MPVSIVVTSESAAPIESGKNACWQLHNIMHDVRIASSLPTEIFWFTAVYWGVYYALYVACSLHTRLEVCVNVRE